MEEHSLELKGQIQQIYSVLIKDEHDKMPFQGIEIAKTISKIPFFKKHFQTTSQQFINLCINQDAKQYQVGLNIYEKEVQQALERYIYIILEGEVEIKQPSSKTKLLGVFRILGQVQILFGIANRLQQAIVKKKVKLMRIKQSSLLKIFTKKEEIKKCFHYLNVNQYFKALNGLEKMHLSLCLLQQHYCKGEIIKNEDQPLDKVFFFIYGKIEVITKLTINSKQQDYVIDTLAEMSTFGQFESVTKIASNIKLKAVVSGAYYYMKYNQLQKQGHLIINIVGNHSLPYPGSQELTFLEEIKTKVRKEENKIMKNYWR